MFGNMSVMQIVVKLIGFVVNVESMKMSDLIKVQKESLHGEEDRMLKTSEVVEMLGITRSTILKLVNTKQFPEPDWVSDSGYKYWWKSTIYYNFNKKQVLAS